MAVLLLGVVGRLPGPVFMAVPMARPPAPKPRALDPAPAAPAVRAAPKGLADTRAGDRWARPPRPVSGVAVGVLRDLRGVPTVFPSAACRLVGAGLRRRTGVCAFCDSGWGRQSTSSLPMDCTGAQPSRLHRAAPISARASRSSPKTLTLISPCDDRARSVSMIRLGVSPDSEISTTGDRPCACALRALRSAEVSAGAAGAVGLKSAGRSATVPAG